MSKIPVVNLSGIASDDAAACRSIGESLEHHGFVAVIGHSVDLSLLEQAYACANRFFALPVAEKCRYERPDLHGQRGYTSFGREHAKDYSAPDLKEFYQIGRELPADHQDASPFGPNIWPTEIPDFGEVYEKLYAALEKLGRQLLRFCSVYLGEDSEFLPGLTVNADSILRAIHYPPTPEDAPPGSMRSAPHEDINLITLLCGATAAGLEVQARNGDWLPVVTRSDQIVVNCGDMLQNLTNGQLRSTKHRVVNPDDCRSSRLSLPFFMHPRKPVDLTPLPRCVARTGNEQRFPSITAGEYLTKRLQEIGLAK